MIMLSGLSPRLVAALSLCVVVPACRCEELRPVQPDRGVVDLAAKKPDSRRPDARPATPPPSTPTGKRRPLTLPCEPPMKVAAGDLDGTGGPEIVVACDDALLVLDGKGQVRARTAAEGWPQVLLVADLSGTGKAEVLAGWGTSRKRLKATARLLRYRVQGKTIKSSLVLEPTTTRAQFADIALERAGKDWSVLLAHFTSKYMVRHVRLRPGDKTEELGRWRMAMSLAPASVPAPGGLLVGRLYGDALGLDGDAFVWQGGKKLPIPTARGVGAVAAADLDGDGTPELMVCDGWAQRYAAEGRALLTQAVWDGKAFTTRRLLELSGEYAINKVQAVDEDGYGKPELLVRGSSTLQLFRRQAGVWQASLLARNVGDAVAADLDGSGRPEVVLVGQEAAIISLEAPPPRP